ncbi:MAG TPA: tyrosine-type recombinase/integrase [Burkholderiaceae bacterium]
MQAPNAALTIIEALKDPGLGSDQRGALLAALQALHTSPAAAPAKRAKVAKPFRRADSMRLSRESIAAMQLPATGERYVYDDACAQLAVRLRPGGRSFVVVMWDSTRSRTVKHTLGKTNTLTPEQARIRAQALVARIASGDDVRRNEGAGFTLAELIRRWHSEKTHGIRTADELRDKALHYLGPLAHRPASEVTRQDIGNVHHRIATTARKRVHKRINGELRAVEIGEPGMPATADKWRVVLGAIYGWATRKGLVMDNPASGIEAAYSAKDAERSSYLHGDALQRFWIALKADRDAAARDVLLLAIHTGQRRGNVLGMRWDQLDLVQGRWTVSADQTKQRKVQTTPLNSQALEILALRYQDAGSEPWVFPATRGHGAMTETRPRAAWGRIRDAAELGDLRIHDLRHTAGSWLARLGANEAVRKKALGHQTSAMAARYSHLELDPVAAAMQGMGDAIEAAATKVRAPVRKPKGRP